MSSSVRFMHALAGFAAAFAAVTCALPAEAAGEDGLVEEECEFHRCYIGSAATAVLPQGGSDSRRLGGGMLSGGWYFAEFWAVEADASLLEDSVGFGARVLWHWWGYERFDPFFTAGARGVAGGDDRAGPAAGVGAFYHLTERWSLRFDAESYLGLDGDRAVDHSLSLGLQFFF